MWTDTRDCCEDILIFTRTSFTEIGEIQSRLRSPNCVITERGLSLRRDRGAMNGVCGLECHSALHLGLGVEWCRSQASVIRELNPYGSRRGATVGHTNVGSSIQTPAPKIRMPS